jgi:hypothetical protein
MAVNNNSNTKQSETQGNAVIRRIRKRKNYTVLANGFLQNSAMSLEARGLLCLMLSLPDDWVFRFNWLAKQAPKLGRFKLRRIMRELETFGFIRYRRIRTPQGKFAWQYEFSEVPFTDESPGVSFSPVAEPPTVESPTVNRPTYKEPIKQSRHETKDDSSLTGERAYHHNNKEANASVVGVGTPSAASQKEDTEFVQVLSRWIATCCKGSKYKETSTAVRRTARALGTYYDHDLELLKDEHETMLGRWFHGDNELTLRQLREYFGLERAA